MIYGYVRVQKNASNRELAEERQAELLQELGAEKIFIESDGSQMQDMLVSLESGDAVHVVSLDRLGRSIQRIVELVDCFKKNNIALYEANQPVDLNLFLQMYELSEGSQYDVKPEQAAFLDKVKNLFYRIKQKI